MPLWMRARAPRGARPWERIVGGACSTQEGTQTPSGARKLLLSHCWRGLEHTRRYTDLLRCPETATVAHAQQVQGHNEGSFVGPSKRHTCVPCKHAEKPPMGAHLHGVGWRCRVADIFQPGPLRQAAQPPQARTLSPLSFTLTRGAPHRAQEHQAAAMPQHASPAINV